VKPLKTPTSAAAPRNICRMIAHPMIFEVQRTGIFLFKRLRCAEPFDVALLLFFYKYYDVLHLLSFQFQF
jgi:hypothetical protein